jgi:predicted dehydrogenase
MSGLVTSGMLTSAAAEAGAEPVRRIRVLVVGGGLITQAVHLPFLKRLPLHFEVVGFTDPSRTVRDEVGLRYEVDAMPDFERALGSVDADAVILCSPTALHAEQARAALDAGLHVLVEKPACLLPSNALEIGARARGHGLVAMVAYMKRYDPAYRAMLSEVPRTDEGLRFIEATTYDPVMARSPFFRPGELVVGADVPAELRAAVAEQERAQIAELVGPVSDQDAAVFAAVFAGALSHDLNLVHGFMDAMGIREPGRVVGASSWNGGDAVSGTIEVGRGIRWNVTWLLLEGMQRFVERVHLYHRDRVQQLEFAAPYLSWPSTYISDGTVGAIAERRELTPPGSGYAGELLHFHDCIAGGADCETPVEDAWREAALAGELFLAAQRSSLKRSNGELLA